MAHLAARKHEEQNYPEFLAGRIWSFLAWRFGGRFSRETSGFITELARARARSETALMRKRASKRGGCDGVVCLGVPRPRPLVLLCRFCGDFCHASLAVLVRSKGERQTTLHHSSHSLPKKKRGPRERVAPGRRGPEGWEGQNFVFFCHNILEFWWYLKRLDLKCARLEFSGCRVKPRQP